MISLEQAYAESEVIARRKLYRCIISSNYHYYKMQTKINPCLFYANMY